MAVHSQPYVLEYVYPRSLGPVLSQFFTGLRDGKILGARTTAGKVLVPPTEYDPDTSDAIVDLVEVATRGVVTTWAWIDEPRPFNPLAKAFAWALIQLDGADTALLHAVDVPSAAHMKTGMRVRARFRAERKGELKDIVSFVPEDAPLLPEEAIAAVGGDPVKILHCPVHLDFIVSAGTYLSKYLDGLAEKRILGGKDPVSGKVYVPPRGASPTSGLPTAELVDVRDTGTLTTFCTIEIPFENAAFPPPYAMGAILLDGADLPIFHLIRGVPVSEVRMGMRLRASWVPPERLGATLENIQWFEPSGEPDAEFSTYQHHL